MAETLVRVRDLEKHFPVDSSLRAQLFGSQRYVHAVDGVSFEINRGEIFGLAGESGCGKTTTGLCLTRLLTPTSGEIRFGDADKNIAGLDGQALRSYRRDVQIVFQDPYESINDRFTVGEWVREPLVIHGIGTYNEKLVKVRDTLEQCGLSPAENFVDQYPHELSGGQRQRVALARAMVLDPSFLVADEPTSMLDVSVRAGVLSVLQRLTREEDVTILYISHDLSLLRYICDRIAIMYQGEIMELGDANRVLQDPKHPYTQTLLRAVPRVEPGVKRDRVRIPPDVEERIGAISGCPFKDRCEYRFEKCDEKPTLLDQDGGEQRVACHLYDTSVDRPLPVYEGEQQS